MYSSLLKKAVPHLVAVVLFLVVALVYCKPALDGKVLNQSDVVNYKWMSQQSAEYKAKYGHFPLWTESAFGGMPGYNIAMDAKSKIQIGYLSYIITLGLPKPISFFFLAAICFYILTQVLRINPWVGILASLAFAYGTFNPVLVAVGHESEFQAIGYAPAVVASLLLIYQGRRLAGAALLVCFIGLQMSTQHLQIIYYTGWLCAFITVAFVVKSWKEKTMMDLVRSVPVAIAAALVGFGTYAITLLPTNEYAKETIRGGQSELTGGGKSKSKGGLDKDYAFQYSNNLGETLTLIVPGAYGGGTDGKLYGEDSKFVQKMEELGYPEDAAIENVNSLSYWGAQPIQAGTVYMGAVVCFLFILGIVFVQGWTKWWILTAAVVGILLSWGKYFPSFNFFLFDHLPFYNKFRAPTMALFFDQFSFPLLAALGLDQLLKIDNASDKAWKKFKSAVIISGGLLLLITVIYFSSDFKSPNDNGLKENLTGKLVQQAARGKQPTPEVQQQATAVGNSVISALKEDRKSLFGSDLLRTTLFIVLAAALVGLYLKKRIKPIILIIGLLVISSYDLLAEARKYLGEDNFVDPDAMESAFAPDGADQKILSDPNRNFRVFNESVRDFTTDARTSYFHNSLGGYHPAKLALYQDLIENQLSKGNFMVFNMLNTKYIIRSNPATGQRDAMVNPNAFGPCWLVKSIHYVGSADEEMKALDSINVRDTAIVDKRYEGIIPFAPVADSSATIKLLENLNDKITYSFSAKTNQFAVFSEIYYAQGWDVYLDGKKVDYCRVDYVLRGMPVPAGNHQIEFRFEPHSYELGSTITIFSSLIGYVLLFLAVVLGWKKAKEYLLSLEKPK
jgi:Bacterial membrane protein YfhO